MKIGIDASRALRKEKTGTEWYSHHIIRSLLALDADGELILYADRALSVKEKEDWTRQNAHSKVLAWPFKKFWTQGRLSIEMLTHAPDVLFVPAHAIPIAHPRRTVTTLHDIGFLRYPQFYSRKDFANLKWSTRYALTHASKVITISEFSKKELCSAYAVSPQKICVIHLGLDHDIFYPHSQDDILRVRHTYEINKPYVITIGRIDGRKNIVFLMEVFETLKKNGYQGELVIVGPRGYQSDTSMRRIDKSPYARDIRVLGWIEEQKKASLLSGADAFLFSSLYEGFGLPVIEAQACGTAVLCSDTGALKEIASDGAVFCTVEAVDPWISALERLNTDSSQKKDLLYRGKLNADRFTWQKTARETYAELSCL